MNFNCIVPNFNFLGTSVLKLEVQNSISSLTDDLTRKFGMDIITSELSSEEQTRIGKVLLKILVELERDGKNVCTIDMILEGAFSSPISVDEEKFTSLVMINGASALFSVGRAKVESISSLVFASGKLVLPFVNIYDFYQQKEKEK